MLVRWHANYVNVVGPVPWISALPVRSSDWSLSGWLFVFNAQLTHHLCLHFALDANIAGEISLPESSKVRLKPCGPTPGFTNKDQLVFKAELCHCYLHSRPCCDAATGT
jgi:hypothetical protein